MAELTDEPNVPESRPRVINVKNQPEPSQQLAPRPLVAKRFRHPAQLVDRGRLPTKVSWLYEQSLIM